jgi:uncharacterized protein (TIGR00661 family)
MRILISPFAPPKGTWGGITRALAIAKTAQAMGHDVAFCVSGYQKFVVEQHGYAIYSLPSASLLGLPKSLSDYIEKRSQNITQTTVASYIFNNLWTILVSLGYANTRYLRELVNAEMQIVEQFQPDILFTDLDLGAFLVAKLTELPIAMTYQGIITADTGGFSWHIIKRTCETVLCHYHQEPILPETLLFSSKVLKIVPSIPELDGAPINRDDIQYVGNLSEPVHPYQDTIIEPGHRYVFAYLGTGSISLHVLESVLPRIFPEDGDVLCLVGTQGVTQSKTIGNVHIHPFIPVEEVLPYCEWTICHGGQNTIIQSLLYGVPLIIFPNTHFERRFNATKIVESGAGVIGEMNQFTPEWLQSTLAKRSELAERAVSLGEKIRSFGGAQTAVLCLEKWANSLKEVHHQG